MLGRRCCQPAAWSQCSRRGQHYCSDKEYRDGARDEDLLGDAAQQGALDAAPPVGAHDHGIRPGMFDSRQQLIGQAARAEPLGDQNSSARQLGGYAIELVCSRGHFLFAGEIGDHANERQLGPCRRCQRACGRQGHRRLRRPIQGDQERSPL